MLDALFDYTACSTFVVRGGNKSMKYAMDEELEKLYLQNIEEYIFDEDKIVTYKWMSKTLNIHVNTAKQLLYTFATEIESDRKADLQLTYLVGGLLHDGKGCKFQVVREDDLEKVKNQFKVVTSEHIYSIHKSKRLPDLNILYGIDSIRETDDGSSKMQGTIQCKKSVRRLEEQLAELRLQSRAAALCANGKPLPTTAKNNSLNKQKSNSEEPSRDKNKPGSLFTTQSSKAKKTESADQKNCDPVEALPEKKKPKATGSITSLFSAQSSKAKKADAPEPKKSTSEEVSRDKTTKAKSSGSISTMFAAQANKPKNPTKADQKSASKEQTTDSKSSGPVAMKITAEKSKPKTKIVEQKDVEKASVKRKHKASEKAKPANKGKGKKSKQVSNSDNENSHPVKKRKRIMTISDSESSDDDIFVKEEEEEEDDYDSVPEMATNDAEPVPAAVDSDVEDIIPSTPQQQLNKGRKRKRKLVDKTFTDEDGYIVTKKEYVYASCSGSEAEEEKENERTQEKNGSDVKVVTKSETSLKTTKAAPKKKNSPKKKDSPPQKAKQMTLTSFFKKS